MQEKYSTLQEWNPKKEKLRIFALFSSAWEKDMRIGSTEDTFENFFDQNLLWEIVSSEKGPWRNSLEKQDP